MEQWLYVMFIEKTKTYNRLTKAAVERHVANIRALDDEGRLELCGVFKGYPGVAGMYILRADSYEEAEELCKREPLVTEGFATYKLKALQVANRENNYLL
ncbi:MAG: YciI family protein [Oscillospiraceae bacterium]|nr:YciI family protein [Oscillospiraceae bacterium]